MREYIYGGAFALILASGCGSKLVGIGHGRGGSAGDGGEGGGGDELVGVAAKGGTTFTAGSSAVGAGGDDAVAQGGDGSNGEANPGPDPNEPQAQSDKLDLLLAIDNSMSMRDKQELLAKAVPGLIRRLINPACVDDRGNAVARPDSPEGACPAGSAREIAPLRDLHVGMISSSLGSHGANGPSDLCTTAAGNDRAHLVPTLRGDVETYQNQGYLKWDPEERATPKGENDPEAFITNVQSMVRLAGEHGCGFEAQLESVYRFLVDPSPPENVVVPSGEQTARPQGIDNTLLQQREGFLRPDSSVVVLMLSDENDCSIVDEGYGWLLARQSNQMFKATSACAANPNDACCQSCAETQANPGCPEISADPACTSSTQLEPEQDSMNLRCFEHKRRFGFDLLYPLSRYVQGFGGYKVHDRDAKLVENPLFHRGNTARSSTLFTFAFLGGVPWQDLATPASLESATLEYLSADQLVERKRWPVIAGDPSRHVAPTDPFMQESIAPRSGKNPVTGAEITPASSLNPKANPINGHEHTAGGNDDLQYACTFELAEPLICDEAAFQSQVGCECYQQDLDAQVNRSVCNPVSGGAATTTQHFGKAYPSLRQLAVTRDLGRRSVLGSVCAPNNPTDEANFAYAPMVRSLTQRLQATLVKP
jgi:hypothetical protein